MRAYVRLDDDECLEWLPVEQGLHQGCVLALHPVQYFLRGDGAHGLHAFQSGRRHHGRAGGPQGENGDGEARGDNGRRGSPGNVTLGYAIC